MTPHRPQDADARSPAHREWMWTAGAALLVVAFSLAFLAQDRQWFWNDDVQTFQLPGYQEVARGWMHGEVPLLNPHSWFGGALAGEYQYGVFSVFLSGLGVIIFGAGLPLPYAAAAFAVVHLVVLAAGSFRLARTRGLAPHLALLVALVACLNGWMFVWGAKQWFTALASFAWLVWAWWALERALRPGADWRRFLPAGLFLYLTICAGRPFTVLMLVIVSAWLILRTLGQRRWLAAWPVAAAWLVGLGLSAPAWMMLIEYSGETLRSTTPATRPTDAWVIPPPGWIGLVFPGYIGSWNVFHHNKPHALVEMTGGLVPLAILAATLFRRGKDFLRRRWWECCLLLFMVVLCMLPGLGNFQYPFRWMPLFFLVLGLLAAHGLQTLQERAGAAPNLGLWAAAPLLAVWLLALWLNRDPTHSTLVQGAILVAACLGWAVVGLRRGGAGWGERLRRWAPAAVFLLSCSIMYVYYAPFAEVPTWRVDDAQYERPPLDRDLRYMSIYARPDFLGDERPDVINPGRFPGVELFPGNTASYAGVEMVNGYSPMEPRGLALVLGVRGHGYFTSGAGGRLLKQEAGPDGLLQRMAVDGLVVSDRFLADQARLEAQGWRPTADVAGGRVFRRDGPASPRVRSLDAAFCDADADDAIRVMTDETGRPAPPVLSGTASGEQKFAPAEIGAVAEGRSVVTVEVANPSADRDAVVFFSRPWHAGYRAEVAGKPLPVSVVDQTMPAVRLPPGTRGRLVLRYEPRSYVVGATVAAATAGTLVLLLGIAWLRRLARRRRAASARAEPPALVSASAIRDRLGNDFDRDELERRRRGPWERFPVEKVAAGEEGGVAAAAGGEEGPDGLVPPAGAPLAEIVAGR